MALVLSDEEKQLLIEMVDVDEKASSDRDRSFYLIPANYSDPLPTLAHSYLPYRISVQEGKLLALTEASFLRHVKTGSDMLWFEVTELGRQCVRELRRGPPEQERISDLLREADRLLHYPRQDENQWRAIAIYRDHWYHDMVSFIGEYFGQSALSSFKKSLPSINIHDSVYERMESSCRQFEAGKLFLESLRGRPVKKQMDPQITEASMQKDLRKVFVVHGHDESALERVRSFLHEVDLDPQVLRDLPSKGKTLVEKIDLYADQMAYAVVILSPDDVGYKRDAIDKAKARARQNVIFEWGFVFGRLGRDKACVLLSGGVEMPSDLAGIVYEPLDERGAWKVRIGNEIKAAGLPAKTDRITVR